jgi:branched-chain amino acid transport system ATP-binding protein
VSASLPNPLVPDATGEALLAVEALEMRFGGIVALHEVSFEARRGLITAVIGPNGAGKTTLFNCVTGMYRPSGGRVLFRGQDLTRLSPFRIARAGIARTFQNLALFEGLSVRENLLVGAYRHGRSGLLEGALRLPRTRREERDARERADATLRFLGLSDLAERRPAELSYGVQKQVEFARALMGEAELILLDEPMAGMNAAEKARLVEIIRDVRDRLGVSFLLVEHDMPVIMGVSDHVVVLDFGRKIAEGPPRAVREDPAVIAAYLGADAETPTGAAA